MNPGKYCIYIRMIILVPVGTASMAKLVNFIPSVTPSLSLISPIQQNHEHQKAHKKTHVSIMKE